MVNRIPIAKRGPEPSLFVLFRCALLDLRAEAHHDRRDHLTRSASLGLEALVGAADQAVADRPTRRITIVLT